MSIYIVAFILCMVIGLVAVPVDTSLKENKRKTRYYLFFVTLFLGLISGFRSLTVGYDTEGYSWIFDSIDVGTIKHIIESAGRIEPGFAIWCAVVKLLGGDFQWLLITTSLFVMLSFSIFIYRHSKSVIWSVFILFCFQYYYSSFDIIRHFMATSFLLLGYKYVEQRRFLPFLLFILLGSSFHKIAFLFTFYYFVPLMKWNNKTLIYSIIFMLVFNAFIPKFAVKLGFLLGKGDFSQVKGDILWVGGYSGGEKTFVLFLIIFVLMYGLYIINKRRGFVNILTNNESMTFCYLIMMFALFFINARIMTRFIMTSSAFLAIAIPNMLIPDGYNRIYCAKQKRIAAFIIVVGLIYNLFLLYTNWQNVVPYVPFWQ